ncbi:MAG: flagellar biosynthesis protein FlhF [Pseudomonadota bacterium]
MNAKKYIAATSHEALRMVRNELGADAVILSNRKVANGIEIMAMANTDLTRLTESRIQPTIVESIAVKPRAVAPVDAPAPAPAVAQQAVPVKAVASAVQEQASIMKEIKSMRDMLQEQLACIAWTDRQQRDPEGAQLLRTMLSAGFSPALSRQVLDKKPAGAGLSWVRQVIGHNLRTVKQEDNIIEQGGIYALVGPTGVGKTTTTAKLAARAVVRYGASQVALLSMDSYRIGAHEQLRIYGKMLGVAVHAVRDTEELRHTLSTLKNKKLVLIDTIGMGQRDTRVTEQSAMFDACGVKRLLMLNATSGGDTLEEVVQIYNGANVIGCIPTKLDEAVTLGAVLDTAVRHKLALHFIANGQRVPEDIHDVNLEYLMHRTFRQKAKATVFSMQELEVPALMSGLGAASAVKGAAYAF